MPQASFDSAIRLFEQGQLAKAARICGDVIRTQPNHLGALDMLGIIELQSGHFDRALRVMDRSLALGRNDSRLYVNRGVALWNLKRPDEAVASYEKAIAADPHDIEAHHDLARIQLELHRPEAALESSGKAIDMDPRHFGSYCLHGNALHELGKFDDAVADYDRALTLVPHHPGALYNRANSLKAAGRRDEAFRDYDETIALAPGFADAHHNRGMLLAVLRNFEEAARSFEKAIALKPDHIDAFCGHANALRHLKRPTQALAVLERAIALKPDHSNPYYGLGNVLRDLRQLDAALENYGRAIELKPDNVDAYRSRADTLLELGRLEESLQDYDRAVACRPDHDFLLGDRLFVKMKICDWLGLDEDFRTLLEKVEEGKKASQPLIVLAVTDSPALQQSAAATWMRERYPVRDEGRATPRPRGNKIRVGYFSADFREHPISYLLAGLFEHHDKSRFETVAFSFFDDPASQMLARIKPAFDKFIDVSGMADAEIVALARSHNIDIAVDLMAFTRNARPNIFAQRAAPIQVNYPYPGTMGTDFIDYLIADATVIPEASRPFYTEKVVYLPHGYQANDDRRRIAQTEFTRSELGLPENGFVFCSFNNSHKITPSVFDGWMRILQRTEGSVLWLLEDNPIASRNLVREAAKRGVDGKRLVFGGRLPMDQHLARHRAADLFLDTLPYNAHATASDALWAGLPVLTLAGESFAGRVAASVLNAVGLPELVTTSQEAYEDTAVRLATDRDMLGALKTRLERNRLTSPLFDTAQFTRHLEAAYTQMVERHASGLPPADLTIAP